MWWTQPQDKPIVSLTNFINSLDLLLTSLVPWFTLSCSMQRDDTWANTVCLAGARSLWTWWEHFNTIINCKFRGKCCRISIRWFWEWVSSFPEGVLWVTTRDKATEGTAEAEWRRKTQTECWTGKIPVPWRQGKAPWKASWWSNFMAWPRLVRDVKKKTY